MTGIANIADVLTAEAEFRALDLPVSTYDVIRSTAMEHPGAPALSFFLKTEQHKQAETWSYRELLENIHRTANLFHHLGATRETVIAYILPNLPETHFVIWGGQASGVVTAINPLLEAPAMAELLNAAQATILVTLAPFPGTDLWPKVHQAIQQVPCLQHLILVNLTDRVRGLKRWPARFLQQREVLRLHGREGVRQGLSPSLQVHDFNSQLRRQRSNYLESARVFSPEDASSFFCTGGTTGTPKLAMRCHRNEVANAWSAGRFLGDGVGKGKTIFCGLPLFHVNAVLVTGLLPFSRGAHVVLGTPQGYRGDGVVEQFWDIVEHHRINFFSGVPTLYTALLDIPFDGHDISSLEYGLCGAAPMPVEVFRTFQKHTGLKILEGYGLTEGTCVSSVNPPLGERRLGSIGLRVPGQLMKAIILDDNGRYVRDCQVDETGVIVISGANVFSGYRIPEQNEGLWIDCGDDRQWLNTGDLGRQDSDGYFWLTGRKKELIIRGGHNIDPAAIEEPLHSHPSVQIAAAVGRPDSHAGEIPVAYVQLKPNSQITEAELLAFTHDAINERAARPKRIHIIDDMPLTAVGKIFKPTLKYLEISDALTTTLEENGIGVIQVSAQNDKATGTLVTVELRDEKQSTAAAQILGRFSLAITISTYDKL